MNLIHSAYADLPKGGFSLAAIQITLAISLWPICWPLARILPHSWGTLVQALPSYLWVRARLNYRMWRLKSLHQKMSDIRLEIVTMGSASPPHLRQHLVVLEQKAERAGQKAYDLIVRECPHVLGYDLEQGSEH